MVWNGEANCIVVEDYTWEGGVLNPSVDPGRRPALGAFGCYGVRKGGLIIRNGPHTHNVYVLARVDWTMVKELAQKLHDEGRLCRDDALKLFVYMIPRGTERRVLMANAELAAPISTLTQTTMSSSEARGFSLDGSVDGTADREKKRVHDGARPDPRHR